VSCGWTEAEIKARDDLNIATVAYYRELGYLPAAVVNFLLRLGWALNDKDEIFPLEAALANFDTKKVTKKAADFDQEKLAWVQGEYMKQLSPAEKVERALPYLRRAKLVGDPVDPAAHHLLVKIAEASGERIKLLSDFVFYAAPLLKPVPEYNPKAVADKLAKPGTADRLRAFADDLRAVEPFDVKPIMDAFTAFATRAGIKPRDLDGPVRVAITGETVGFGLPETMVLLGRDQVLARVEAAIKLT
jgi:nondiscriminating glutamyl-tRNA synthetase